MTGRDELAESIDGKLRDWRQGDVSLASGLEFIHLADLSCPHTAASIEAASNNEELIRSDFVPVADQIEGIVVLTQTCDIVRSCRDRPFIEVAPLVKFDDEIVEQVRRLKRPAFAYVPGIASKGLVADLDRVMTVEKAVVANWPRTSGCSTDDEDRDFASAIARKRSRFAFPDDFVRAAVRFRGYIMEKHDRNTAEGSHLRALREIRVRGAPSWNHDEVELTIWFIKESEPEYVNADWSGFCDKWGSLFDVSGRFSVNSAIACRLEDITALEYVESDVLDLDSLSVGVRE